MRSRFPAIAVVIALAALVSTTPVSKTISKHGTSAHQPTIKSPLGNIQGSIMTSRAGKTIYAFRGIRYAKAPVEELRFQPPVAVEKWEGSYNATENGAACPQPDISHTSEDCLNLNVYATKLPKGNENPKFPVIVFLHPGGLYKFSSSSDLYGPQYLLDQEIVLVTVNFRLGSLGFLSTGDKEAPGNNGFKDQVEALKWVQANIASFGGDPEKVTLAGYSAGALSVSLHLASPMSKDLFHRAIVASGSAYGNIPICHNQMELAKKQARLLGCSDETSLAIITCLKTKSADDLGNSLAGFKDYGKDPTWIWLPVIEGDFGQPRFLSEHPMKTIMTSKFNKVPVMTGITTDEMGYKAYDLLNNDTMLDLINKDFEKIAPVIFSYGVNSEKVNAISENIEKFYFEDKELGNETLTQLAQLYSDSLFGFPVNQLANAVSLKLKDDDDDVFYYLFSSKGEVSNFNLPGTTKPYGVVHGDDLLYLFQGKTPIQFKDDMPELSTLKKLTLMWKNFAETGNPTPEQDDDLDKVTWEAFEADTNKYLDIGPKLAMKEKLFEKRYAEWEKWYPMAKYGEAVHG